MKRAYTTLYPIIDIVKDEKGQQGLEEMKHKQSQLALLENDGFKKKDADVSHGPASE
jgi:hypothetical protein